MFSVESLANQLFISNSNLNRKIKKLFGVTTIGLIKSIRLQNAAELLNIYNKSVSEAAMLSGFYDTAHLSHYFKPVFGYSPNDYRGITPFYTCIDILNMNKTDNLLLI